MMQKLLAKIAIISVYSAGKGCQPQPIDLTTFLSHVCERSTTDHRRSSMQTTTVLSFKELKQRISIEQVLRYYQLFDGLRMRGKSHRGPCPFCEAHDGIPFSVSLEKGYFQCFACKASGNIGEHAKPGELRRVLSYKREVEVTETM
jgi:hypothetical protein